MRASMSKKSLISGIFILFMLLLLAGNASSEVEPVYAGWTVGDSWDDDGEGPNPSYGTILRSTDSGETWIRQGEGQIADVGMGGVFAVDPDTAWVVGRPDSSYATIYHTTDGGVTWDRKGSSNPAAANYIPNVELAKVHAAGDDVWAVGDVGVILHSSDGGETWTNHIPDWDEYKNTHFQGVYVVDSSTAWVTGGSPIGVDVILKTTDAGKTWTRQSYVFPPGDDSSTPPQPNPPGYFLGISAVDTDTAWTVGNNFTILKTTNGGATWSVQGDPGDMNDYNEVYAVSSSTVWIAGDYAILRTLDGGKNWESFLSGEKAFMGISAVSADEAWASHAFFYGGIYHTTDGGSHWTIIEELNGQDLPGLWTISFATQPITDYLLNSLIEDVEQLVDDGILNQGQGNALIVKLKHALDRLADDRLKAAVNALEAFSNQVDAFVQGGVLPSEIGQDLSNQVNKIIELLGFPL